MGRFDRLKAKKHGVGGGEGDGVGLRGGIRPEQGLRPTGAVQMRGHHHCQKK